ncbi:MAG: anhydro-N-acetylmuramic acid kinase, partial [Bacteroidia bacterium]|nr:anhydro-N-acetylmuramic acid kinase [Bacteroidia bacterium]
FGQYDYCLNLGGFANISYHDSGRRIAFDICPVNIIINELASILGFEMDKDGSLAEKGLINMDMLSDLNMIPYYFLKSPKSLGKEWLVKEFFPVSEKYQISVKDKLRTIYEHIAIQISNVTIRPGTRMLVTGGGAHNRFLVNRIKELAIPEIIIPDQLTVDFKEALIFAFLGLLRNLQIYNCLRSVTGAKTDNCGGNIVFMK